MRHFLLPGTVAALAFGVPKATPAGALVPAAGRLLGKPAGGGGASLSTVDIAAVTEAADDNLPPTTGTVVKTGRVLHRQPGPMRAGKMAESSKYYPGSCIARRWGAVPGNWSSSRPGIAPVSNGLLSYPVLFCCHAPRTARNQKTHMVCRFTSSTDFTK